ncbi:MAG: hypothetical protein J07HB67_01661 [halophilic archaeon J07HB67]|nr:MAG: hypothetical protein J07HB67_01661 [halophilic archaeon J07HB67]
MNVALVFGVTLVVGSLVGIPVTVSQNEAGRRRAGLLVNFGFWLAYGLFSLRGVLGYPSVVADALTLVGGVALLVSLALLIPEL